MVTPFDEEEALDLSAAVTLAKALEESGTDGLVLGGTTGEGSTLTDDEKLSLFAAVAEAVSIPVIAGSTSNDTAHSVALTAAASSLGVAGILVTGPYYNRPSQLGIAGHFRAVCEATALPVIAYDIPVRTGRRISPETLRLMADQSPNLVAVKDASADLTSAAEGIAQMAGRLEWYSGDDSLTLAFAALGASGVISVASHWGASEFHDIFSGVRSGDLELARSANARLFESYRFQGNDTYPNPLPAKAMARLLGFSVGQCRLPMGVADSELDVQAKAVYERLVAARG
jgi:4-hydroxy-tetrahydrodipicolinate synthase